jgi:hypothetical protein
MYGSVYLYVTALAQDSYIIGKSPSRNLLLTQIGKYENEETNPQPTAGDTMIIYSMPAQSVNPHYAPSLISPSSESSKRAGCCPSSPLQSPSLTIIITHSMEHDPLSQG